MGDGEVLAPPQHDAHLDGLTCSVGSDEHHHVVVLADVVEGKTQRMQHVLVEHAMPMRRVEDEGFGLLVLHCTRLLVVGPAAKHLEVDPEHPAGADQRATARAVQGRTWWLVPILTTSCCGQNVFKIVRMIGCAERSWS